MKMSVVVIVASLSLVPNFFFFSCFMCFSPFFFASTLGRDRNSGVGWGLASCVVWVFLFFMYDMEWGLGLYDMK